ncbi:permease-like cell division protein FtsX [Anaerobium acetethylicum]|uniref:Cell division protein FtsX n=1 Tax=Anaerobium acetethylicum TaxID=1619234 RepID=A0A1D3TQ87_9FIRM|nr:permease-like cell division protein FtsX [Anaerobium acetethylicum]SCP95687.1 cell division transport system permease protein [Anaerobium acetethylicum]
MRISTITYTLRQGLKNIRRNKMFSLASIATMAACIFIFGLFFSVILNFHGIVKSAEAGVGVTVFFDEGLSEEQIKEIGSTIEKRAEVSRLVYVSAEEAWQNFKEEYFKDAGDLAEGFAEDNPLANSANYEVYLNDVSMQQSLVTYLQSIEGIRQVNKSEVAANTLSGFNMLIGYISAAIIAILLAVSVFLISNTVTIGIAVRKEEIKIMKLIGATDFFVKAPFIVEGVLIGLVGSALPLVALYYLYNNVIGFIVDRFDMLTGFVTFIPVNQIFAILIPLSLALGVGIGFIGSFSTIRKHLKV